MSRRGRGRRQTAAAIFADLRNAISIAFLLLWAVAVVVVVVAIASERCVIVLMQYCFFTHTHARNHICLRQGKNSKHSKY